MIRLSIVGSFVLIMLAATNFAAAQNTQNFLINSFSAEYILTKDAANVSQLKTNEYINVQFPDFNQNHGILRAIPKTYNGEPLNIDILAVNKQADSGSPTANTWVYSSSEQNGNLVLKIGDPNAYAKGSQNFHISYTAQNVTRNYGTYDELYWNVNGTQWQQPILATNATLELSPEISNSLDASKQPVCYTGEKGSTNQNCSITQTTQPGGETIIKVISNAPLGAGENLSFVVAFKPGAFAAPVPSFWERIKPIVAGVIIIGLPLSALFVSITRWRKFGRDPAGRGTIVAEYQPPKESVLLVHEFVLRESGRPLAVTAQIINLAIRGYIRIIDTEKDGILSKKHDFSLQLLKIDKNLSPLELKTIEVIFNENPQPDAVVKLSSLANKLSSKISKLWDEVATAAIAEDYFKTSPKKAMTKHAVTGTLLCFTGFAILFFGSLFAIAFGIGLIASGAIIIISAKFMPARTPKGVTLREYLLGLKLYIKMAEDERIKFHQSPSLAERKALDTSDNSQMVKLFESLLPYAMLFGQEKEWGEQFANIYNAPPAWYGGTMSNFSTGYLLGGLSGFNSATATSFSPPASSGGSGFSGGSSGGGGGGGGGGGW